MIDLWVFRQGGDWDATVREQYKMQQKLSQYNKFPKYSHNYSETCCTKELVWDSKQLFENLSYAFSQMLPADAVDDPHDNIKMHAKLTIVWQV